MKSSKSITLERTATIEAAPFGVFFMLQHHHYQTHLIAGIVTGVLTT